MLKAYGFSFADGEVAEKLDRLAAAQKIAPPSYHLVSIAETGSKRSPRFAVMVSDSEYVIATYLTFEEALRRAMTVAESNYR